MCTFSFAHSSILTLNASPSHFISRMNIGLSHLVIPQETMNDESIARELAIHGDEEDEDDGSADGYVDVDIFYTLSFV